MPVAAAAPLLDLRGVARTYRGGTVALQDVSLSVGAGDFVSLLGPSGCGKSTLLRLVAGLLEPNAGDVGRGFEPARDVGFVFQDPTLMPWATAVANVELPLRLQGVPRAERQDRAHAALLRVGLGGFERSWPRQLSGGMRMRVSLARALVTQAKLLLLDEPFAALDEITRLRLNDDLLGLWRESGFSVLFVTHSVFESVYLSTRVVVMSPRPGRVAADLAVALPQPRTPALRLEPAYAALCREVSQRLAEAMA